MGGLDGMENPSSDIVGTKTLDWSERNDNWIAGAACILAATEDPGGTMYMHVHVVAVGHHMGICKPTPAPQHGPVGSSRSLNEAIHLQQ